MTTLPQTTGARFPRAGGRAPNIPALAQANAGAGAPAGGTGGGLTVADVLRVLRANAWLIILSTLIALIIGFVVNNYVLMKYYQRFTAQTVLQVQMPSIIDPGSPVNERGQMDRQMLEVRQKTLSQKLSSPDLWRPLLQADKGSVASLGWMNRFRDSTGALDQSRAIDEVSKSLNVNPVALTELISVELSAPTANDARAALEAIVDKLVASEQNDVSMSGSDDRKALQSLAQRISTQMAGLDAAIAQSSAIINASQGADGQGNGLSLARQLELQAQMNERIKKQTDYNKAAAQYESIKKTLEEGGIPSAVDQQMSMTPSLTSLEQQRDGLAQQLDAQIKLYGAGHRNVAVSQAQYDAANSAYEKKREELRVSLGAQIKEMAQGQLASAKADLDDSNEKIAGLEKTIGELNNEQLKFNTSKQTRDYLEKQKQAVDERLQILDANASRQSASRGTVRQLFPVVEPKDYSFPNLRMSMGLAGLVGLSLSLGIAFLRELMDTSVRSPRDIARVGQINLLGMIPHTDDDPQAANGDISLIISQEPHSIIAENFRQVRTRLQHTASLDTTRSLLVTSPGPGDGKTTIACNIAAGLALNGRKILLVDANFRRPALHTVFGVTNEAGLGSVLAQSTSASSVVHHTSVPNLDVLTTGPRPANTTELLESQLLTDFIDRTLEEYDHVIFDAGPILLVSETVALAPRVDGVITVVRARANSRGLLQRMRDTLRQLKSEHLGVVLNGVRQHSGGYYRRNIKNYYAYQNGSAD